MHTLKFACTCDMLLVRLVILKSAPPPRPTLFPYTTLFRSSAQGTGRRAGRQLHGHALRLPRPARLPALPARAREVADQDRKSTRLNSSHLGISYAVFCWKKKNASALRAVEHQTQNVLLVAV